MAKFHAFYFVFALTWSLAVTTPTATSNEIPQMVKAPSMLPSKEALKQPSGPQKSSTSVVVHERTLYEDVMQLGRIYAPSLVDLIEFFLLQKENVWELTKTFIRQWIAVLLGGQEASPAMEQVEGQEGRDAQALFTIPVVEYPVTRTQVEGLILDSLAVIKKWQTTNY